jgi:hypothetical protein
MRKVKIIILLLGVFFLLIGSFRSCRNEIRSFFILQSLKNKRDLAKIEIPNHKTMLFIGDSFVADWKSCSYDTSALFIGARGEVTDWLMDWINTQILPSTVEYIVLSIGLNDILLNRSSQHVIEQIYQFTAHRQLKGKKVVIMEIPTILDQQNTFFIDFEQVNAQIIEINNTLNVHCANSGCSSIALPADAQFRQNDGIHITCKGYEKLSAQIYDK